MDLRRQIAIVRRWLPLLVASTLLAGAVAFIVSGFLGKSFQAKVTLIVGQSLSAANPDYTQLLVSQRLSATYAQVALTRPILETVIKDLGLEQTSTELIKVVRADAAPDSTLLTIAAEDPNPARAAAIANALANELIAVSPTIQGRGTEIQKSIDADLVATQKQIDATQAEVDRLAALATPAPADLAKLDSLEARLVTLRSTYAALLAFSSGNAANLLSVVEPAVAPLEPVSPRPLLNALLASILALLVSIGVISLVEFVDDTVRDSEMLEQVARLATLGTIPRMRGDRSRSPIYRLAALLYPRSAAAEAFRTLRANIEFASLDEPVRTLLVTSASPGEGKSVTAANLAVVFAQAGRRVLLVDADLRRPGIHEIFDLPNDHGLTTLLRSDEHSLEVISQKTEVANLRVLTAGMLPANPAEIIGSHRMRAVMDRLGADFDLMIFDSPPLQAVTDSAILGSYLDATLLVVDTRRSRRRAVRQAREALDRAGAHVIGAVINRVAERSGAPYGEYYGYYYTATPDPEPLAPGAGQAPKAAG